MPDYLWREILMLINTFSIYIFGIRRHHVLMLCTQFPGGNKVAHLKTVQTTRENTRKGQSEGWLSLHKFSSFHKREKRLMFQGLSDILSIQ